MIKSSVAEAAVAAGASLINDIWGLKADPDMASVAARTGAACCLMHNRKEANYQDFRKELPTEGRFTAARFTYYCQRFATFKVKNAFYQWHSGSSRR